MKLICIASIMFSAKNLLQFTTFRTNFFECFFSTQIQPHICIVGSGPSGFVAAQTLLKNHPTAKVDVYEKSAVPFGLIRYGVSPDHQDVKNCINGYNKTALNDRFSFFGNVDVGKDVLLSELCNAYHAVILCTGAQHEQKLGIPGENLGNVWTSNQFVGWYNGVPEFQNLEIDLSGKTAVVIGVGNVALDAVRMLFKPTEKLSDTDITGEAFDKFSQSQINTIHLVGRRGPLQMACTRKELAEITDLTDVNTFIEKEHFNQSIQAVLKKKDLTRRKQQRLINYLLKVATSTSDFEDLNHEEKKFFVKFLRSPEEMYSNNSSNAISSIKLKKRIMSGEDVYNPRFLSTEEIEEIKCDLVITCIGYKNVPIDENLIPFQNGKIVQFNGLIDEELGLYACGWCSHGPKGVLADNGNDSLLTGSTVLSDLNMLLSRKSNRGGSTEILKILSSKSITPLSWDKWKRIDNYEVILGKKLGKVREKILTKEEMFSIASL